MLAARDVSGSDRALIAVEQAVVCPLLEEIDLSGAKGGLSGRGYMQGNRLSNDALRQMLSHPAAIIAPWTATSSVCSRPSS